MEYIQLETYAKVLIFYIIFMFWDDCSTETKLPQNLFANF